MAGYARRTTVAPDRTRLEIEAELRKRGATAFGYNWAGHEAVLAFTLNGLAVRMALALPDEWDKQFTHTPGRGLERTEDQRVEVFEAEVRRRWRALGLVVKAKLVAVDEGITSLEHEFLADVVLADGQTVAEQVRPAIEQARQAITGRSA